MIDIQAGDVVVCVDAGASPNYPSIRHSLEKGRAYTVSQVSLDPYKAVVLFLAEAETPNGSGWLAHRFRKVQKCDEDFTEFMKSIKPSKVRA